MNPEIFFIKERIRQKDGVIISGILSEKRKRQKHAGQLRTIKESFENQPSNMDENIAYILDY